MNLASVYSELGTALATISGLRVFNYSADRVTPPAAVLELPDIINYDQTYRRGSDTLTLDCVVLVGRQDARTSLAALATYMDGSGSHSVKAALDGGTYTACSAVTVTTARSEVRTVGDVAYLAATFSVSIYGSGS